MNMGGEILNQIFDEFIKTLPTSFGSLIVRSKIIRKTIFVCRKSYQRLISVFLLSAFSKDINSASLLTTEKARFTAWHNDNLDSAGI